MIELLVLTWLAAGAFSDWKLRIVPNTFTIPMVVLAVILRVSGVIHHSWLLTGGLAVLALAGWWLGGIGGADFKALLAMLLLDPRLALWAWSGAAAWYALIWLATRGKQGPYHLPGFMGFFIGALAYFSILEGLCCLR